MTEIKHDSTHAPPGPGSQELIPAGFHLHDSDIALFPTTAVPSPAQHPAAVYLASLADGPGRASMKSALGKVAAILTDGRADAETTPWAELRFRHVAALRVKLAERYAPASANKALSAVRGVIRAAWRLGQISTDEYQRAIDVPAIKGSRLPAGRALDVGEIRALFQTCIDDETAAGARDAAIFALMFGAGLRRAEVAALQHSALREHQAVDRVVRDPVPVDQVLDHVAVGTERQHGADDFHVEQVVVRDVTVLRNRIEISPGQRLEFAVRWRDNFQITKTVRARPFSKSRRPRDRINIHCCVSLGSLGFITLSPVIAHRVQKVKVWAWRAARATGLGAEPARAGAALTRSSLDMHGCLTGEQRVLDASLR